jgi:hypothetical protein
VKTKVLDAFVSQNTIALKELCLGKTVL